MLALVKGLYQPCCVSNLDQLVDHVLVASVVAD